MSTSYIPATSITGPVIVDGKYLGQISVHSRLKKPEAFKKDFAAAANKHGQYFQGIVEYLKNKKWDVSVIPTNAHQMDLVATTPRMQEKATLTICLEDVIGNAKSCGIKGVTRKVAMDVLGLIDRKMDLSSGLSWDAITTWTYDALEYKKGRK